MAAEYINRVAVVRTRGRRRADVPVTPYEEVEAVLPASAVPSVVECRGCGRKTEPRVISRRSEGVANCKCEFCGARFDYRPPAIRWLDGQPPAGQADKP